MTIKERIAERDKIRAQIHGHGIGEGHWEDTLLLLSECLDDYIVYRMGADKVLEGILKDIEGGIKAITDSMVDVRCYMQKDE